MTRAHPHESQVRRAQPRATPGVKRPLTKPTRRSPAVAGTTDHLEPMHPSDKVFLRMPNMWVSGLLTLDAPLERSELLELIRTRLLCMDRFSQRIVTQRPGAEAWSVDATFDPRRHVKTYKCKGDAKSPELFALVEKLMAQPMDMQRPPWNMGVIRCAGDETVVFVRIHHAVADGMRLMQALLHCHDDNTGLQRYEASVSQALAAAEKAQQASRVGKVVRGAFMAAATARSFGAMLVRGGEPASSLKSQRPVARMALGAVHTPWDLAEVKAIGRALGQGTVNDVLLTVLAGAVRTLLLERGDSPDTLPLRCMHAFNMLPVGVGKQMHNAIGTALSDLPSNQMNVEARFASARCTMQAVKRSVEPVVNATLLGCLSGFSTETLEPLCRRATSQATMLLSNIRGPEQAVRFFGKAVSNVRWYVAPLGTMGLSAPVISYDGKVQMCVAADRALGLDMQHMQSAVEQSYQALREHVSGVAGDIGLVG